MRLAEMLLELRMRKPKGASFYTRTWTGIKIFWTPLKCKCEQFIFVKCIYIHMSTNVCMYIFLLGKSILGLSWNFFLMEFSCEEDVGWISQRNASPVKRPGVKVNLCIRNHIHKNICTIKDTNRQMNTSSSVKALNSILKAWERLLMSSDFNDF